MDATTVILLALGLVCFVLAAIGVPARGVNLTALGLAFWILTALIPAVQSL